MACSKPVEIELNVGAVPKRFTLYYEACSNPECYCGNTYFWLVDCVGRETCFWLDLEKAERVGENSAEDAAVASEFIGFLKAPQNEDYNLAFFKKDCDAKQARKYARSKEIESFRPQRMVNYRAVFGGGFLEASFGGKNYLVVDAYCVMPSCPCAVACLHFFEDVYSLNPQKEVHAFSYDYANRAVEEPVDVSEEQARGFAASFSRSFDEALRRRHKRLKKELRKTVLKKLEECGELREAGPFGNPLKKREERQPGSRFSAVFDGLLEKLGERRPRKPEKKPGRNEPCYCGSGEKYKKCCLEKDWEEERGG